MGMRNKKGQFVKGTHWKTRKPYWDKEWLITEYIDRTKPASQIATEQGCTENNILYFLKKHHINTRTMRKIRRLKYWGSCGTDNPMYNKRGELNPNWKGGVSTERQTFYSSTEWKKACSFVWIRDEATCQRCGIKADNGLPIHVHHIRGFEYEKTRADVPNLVLLCEVCHRLIHSRKNTLNEFIRGGD